MLDPIAIAIPLFFGAIGAEYAVGRRGLGKADYHLPTAIADVSCGITQQVFVFAIKAWIVIPYLMVASFSPWQIEGLWGHLLAFVGVDVCYYAWHRFTHECRLGWVSHVVHHQSEDYNLAVALRQSLTSSISSVPFYLPLALLGIPAEVFLLHTALNTLYQFWIHTEAIRTLGPLEWVLNTPSHHRVHHGVNPQYLDKNYAGVLIVWDRLFGSFEKEDEVPVYGTVVPLQTLNPLLANARPFVDLYRELRGAPTVWDAVAHAVRGPSTPCAWVDKAHADLGRSKFTTHPSALRQAAVLVSFPFVAVMVLALVGWGAEWSTGLAVGVGVLIVAKTLGWARLLSGR